MFKSLFKPIDLTEGKIWKVILFFSFPILLSYLFQQIYSISDAAICGQFLSENQVAGVNNTGNICFIILQFAFGCTAGFSVVASQKIGAKDIDGARKSLLVQMILATILSIVLTILAILLINPLLAFIGVTKESNIEIYEAAYIYTFIIFLGTIAQIFYNLGCSFLRSLGDGVTPLVFLVISCILNIILDILFIVSFNMGVAGAAIATILAQFVAAVGCFVYIFVKKKEFRFKKDDLNFEKGFISKHLKLGIPLALQFSILAFGLIVMQGTIIKFDIIEEGKIAAEAQLGYGAACKLNNFLMMPLNALGTAMLSYSGQNYGKSDHKRIKSGIIQACVMMFIIYLFLLTVGMLATINGAYQYIFMSSDKINDLTIKYGNLFLYTCLPFYPFLGVLFILRNAIQGVERPMFPLIAGIGELFARSLVCTFFPPLINGGPVNRYASDLAYIATSAGDVVSWIIADIPLFIGLFIYLKHSNYELNMINDTKEA